MSNERRKLLFEVFRQGTEPNFQKFLDRITGDDGVIDAELLFKLKKEYDKKFKEALERVNNVGKPIDEDEK